MKYVVALLALLASGCGIDETSTAGAPMPILGDSDSVGTVSTALELEPEIKPEGLNALYSRVTVTDLTLFGALHLVPVRQDSWSTATSAAFKFELSNGEAETTTTGRALRVDRPGRYTVLMAIHPMGNGASVNVEGAVLEDSEHTINANLEACRGEAAPTTADETEMEAAPTTADEDEMEAAPITAADDEEMEAAPITADDVEMEAAPTTADEDEMEAAPITADEDEMEAAPITANEVVMEAAPTTADGATANDYRTTDICRWETRFTSSGRFTAMSTQSFEFDLGIVEITPGDDTLTLYWNMADFIALLMGEELGLSFNELLALHELFMDETDTENDFTPDEVRIETY